MEKNNLEETKNKIADDIRKANSLHELQKINYDINEGINVLKGYDYFLKRIYINRINTEYSLYISTINTGISFRENSFGNQSNNGNNTNIDLEISQLIRMLSLVKQGKLLDEIVKIMKHENNCFMNGILTYNEITKL